MAESCSPGSVARWASTSVRSRPKALRSPSSARSMHGWPDGTRAIGAARRRIAVECRMPVGVEFRRTNHSRAKLPCLHRLKIMSIASLAALAACGGSSSRTSDGRHFDRPRHPGGRSAISHRIAGRGELQAELAAQPSGAQLLQITGDPACGVDFYYIRFWTVGGAGEATESSGALMVPTGAAPGCSGPRPIVLYAHGTNTDKTLNIADITNPANTEGVLIAAMFAAQGYIVVAPNYAGYDISTLGYHPFLNAEQQSGEMIDILTAARTRCPRPCRFRHQRRRQVVRHRLFRRRPRGHGHATRARGRAASTVTGAAPMSGPYALEAFGDAIFFGKRQSRLDRVRAADRHQLSARLRQHLQRRRRSIFFDLRQRHRDAAAERHAARDDLSPTDCCRETALFDSTTPVVTVPGNAMLSAELTAALAVPSDPAIRSATRRCSIAGFGKPYLINNAYRVSYALDAAADPDGAVPDADGRRAARRHARRRSRCAWRFTRTTCATATGRPPRPPCCAAAMRIRRCSLPSTRAPWRRSGVPWCRPA